MIWLFLLAQLGFSNASGGTPHTVELTWPGITVTQANDDGSTFVRPPLGYYVYRAEIKNTIQGPWVVLNPDALVVGMMEADASTKVPPSHRLSKLEVKLLHGLQKLLMFYQIDFPIIHTRKPRTPCPKPQNATSSLK